MPSKELTPTHFPERRIQGECGLFAAYIPPENTKEFNLPDIAYLAATSLQHRAEGAAGMWLSNGEASDCVRELGTVAIAFHGGKDLPQVENPHIAIVHLRYPTAGTTNHEANIQPLFFEGIWLGHHGNLTNTQEIERKIGCLPKGGEYPDSDSWIALNAIVKAPGDSLAKKVINAQKDFEGGWALIVSDGKSIVASRDPYGVRPLFFGFLGTEKGPKGYTLSVESYAFQKLGIRDFYEVLPGETIKIDECGVAVVDSAPAAQQRSCLFEFVYMMRPESQFLGQEIDTVRRMAGHLLWREAPVEVSDGEELVIMPIPDSGRSAALGLFHEAQKSRDKVTWDEALLTDRHFGRNFIKSLENRNALQKFSIIPERIRDRIVILVDDSIVRGDTLPELVKMCWGAGAKAVHVRIASPPIKHPCYWGTAFPTYEELLANKIPDFSRREEYLRVTTLRHLSLEELLRATGVEGSKFCTHCFDGQGPPRKNRGEVPLLAGKAKP